MEGLENADSNNTVLCTLCRRLYKKVLLHAEVLAYSLITRFMTTIDFFHVDYFCGSSCSYHVLCEEFKNNMG
jgi:hypothetical protein